MIGPIKNQTQLVSHEENKSVPPLRNLVLE
jgi:hypothetical protein